MESRIWTSFIRRNDEGAGTLKIKSMRVRDVVFSHEGNNHIYNKGNITLKESKNGVLMHNAVRKLNVFVPMHNILWIVYDEIEPKRPGRPKKDEG